MHFVIWIILSGTWEYNWFTTDDNKIKWFIYLTNWGFSLLTVSVIIQAFVAAHAYCTKMSRGYTEIGKLCVCMSQWDLSIQTNASCCMVLLVIVEYREY